MGATRNLIITGIALITIVALASAVALQQIALQNMSRQSTYMTETVTRSTGYVTLQLITQCQQFTTQTITTTITQQLGTTTSQLQTTAAYILITYSAETADSVNVNGYAYTHHTAGDVYLILTLKVENHGYGQVYLSLNDFHVTISGHLYSYADYIPYAYSWLPNGYVFNGLSVMGNLVYEVPPSYGTFLLSWNHPNDVSVTYVHQ